MTRARRNDRTPPADWEVYCQWYAAKKDGSFCAGDGEAFSSRQEAVVAAWDEHDLESEQRIASNRK